jgi:hypothetical protein
MEAAEVRQAIEKCVPAHERKSSYGWSKFEVMIGIGAPLKVRQAALQIAVACISSGQVKKIADVFNDGELNVNNPVEDILGRLRRKMASG